MQETNKTTTRELELKRIESFIARNRKVVVYSTNNTLSNGNQIYRLLSDIVEDITQRVGGIFSFMHCDDLPSDTISEIKRLLCPGETMNIVRLFDGEKETITLTK